jgi:hypothetical protein
VRWAVTWIAHPVSLLAIAVMALNDHMLKHQWESWWTGKLSDVAGMVFFPALLAVMIALVAPRLHPRRAALLAVAISGVGFAWVKATDAGAATASAVLTALAGPSIVVRDATDLLALPVLALATWVGLRVTGDVRSAVRRAGAVMVLPVALLASVATAKVGPEPRANAAAIVDDNIWVLVDRAHYEPPYADGQEWQWLQEDDIFRSTRWVSAEGIDARLEAVRNTDHRACLPDELDTCFRPTPRRYGVDISRDGGTTWEADFAVTDVQWAKLAKLIQDAEPREVNLITRGVSVGEWNGETVVIAANGVDGVAIRHANGSWERLGWLGSTGGPGLAPMPDAKARDLHVLPAFAIAAVGLCWSVAWVVTGAARRQRREGRWPRRVLAVALLLATVGIGVIPFKLHNVAPTSELDVVIAVIFSVLLACGVAGPILAGGFTAAAGWHYRVGYGWRLGVASAVGFGVPALVWLLVELESLWAYEHRLALAVGAAAVVSGVIVAFRWKPAFDEAVEVESSDGDVFESAGRDELVEESPTPGPQPLGPQTFLP